ncbi:MAG: ADP-ribosylglycohydrolase family protein [Anaerolineaceae bacterium]|nr:ADP-ribosylglycohydrolase family protein [Anaerolineaceae bacterium]
MDKYLGNLLGAAAGDAMGAATEMRTMEQISQKFGGYVRDFFAPPQDTFGRGNKPGQMTDDFSLAYMTCQQILRAGGRITEEVAKEALLAWGDESNYYSRFMGPTTKAKVEELRGTAQANPEAFVVCNDNAKASNGSAMKISPIALFSHGDIDQAIRDSFIVASVTHPNNISLSAACAICAATSAAMAPQPSLQSILDAALRGAEQGDQLGRKHFATLAGPSVSKRIQLAFELGLKARSMPEALQEISDIIGSGLMAAEAVPAVFGILAAAKGDTLESIFGGVNIGNDTDTVATMVGGIVGAWHGAEAFPPEYLPLIDAVSGTDLSAMAAQIRALKN